MAPGNAGEVLADLEGRTRGNPRGRGLRRRENALLEAMVGCVRRKLGAHPRDADRKNSVIPRSMRQSSSQPRAL